MAAALLAALFAMGVFSATGVGADDDHEGAEGHTHPTATAEFNDMDAADGTDQEGDTVTITITGIDQEVLGTSVRIGMPADDLDASSVVADWGGPGQVGTRIETAQITFAAAAYTVELPTGLTIRPGTATLTFTLGAGVTAVDENSLISSLEMGPAAGPSRIIADLPDGGLRIEDAPQGPRITLTPDEGITGEDAYTVTVSGTRFGTGAISLEAEDTNISLTSGDTVAAADITNGAFMDHEIVIPAQAEAVDIVITADQGGAEATRAIFSVKAPEPEDPLSSYIATEAIRIELEATASARIPPGEDITVTLKDFGKPANIPESSVLILGTTSETAGGRTAGPATPTSPFNEPYSGEPAEVRISGNNVILSLTSRYVNGEAAGPLFANHSYTVVFKESAGITNPKKAGSTYKIEMADTGPTKHVFDLDRIQSKVKLVPTTNAGPRGTQLEVTVLGFADGDATVYLGSVGGYRLDKASSSGGVAKVTVDTTTQNFVPGTQPKLSTADETDLEGRNTITAIDASGNTVDNTAQFEITPLIELDGDAFRRGGKVGITVSDWTFGNLKEIAIGGVPVREVPDGSSTRLWTSKYPNGLQLDVDDVEFEFIVPNNARLGEQELKLTAYSNDKQGVIGKDDVAKSKIIVGAFDLTIEPSTAVTDQVIRIEGSGFGRDACIVSIMVGDELIEESTSANKVGSAGATADDPRTCGPSADRVEADSNGNLADTFQVPANLKAGTYRVIVRDENQRIGIAELTVPEPEIELDPPASQRGSNVVVVGRNFPAEDVVTIDYDGRTVTAANTDTVGRFRSTFAVPVNAAIGEEHEVVATSADKADGVGDKALLRAKTAHEVPDEVLEVTPGTAAPGTRITVSASNLPLYTLVGVTIGGVGVAGSSIGELAETDGNGTWSGTPLVPQLTPGTHTVEMTVGKGSTGISVSTFLEIADIITRASDEAFADLIDNGTLTRVWYLDRQTQTWSFFDPAPEFADFNTLEEVSTGQIVTIIMNAQDTFQGQTLFVGSNPTAME